MKKIAICATKGGVGKTTLITNLGAITASSGYRVLLVDADPQPSLSSFYQLAESSRCTLQYPSPLLCDLNKGDVLGRFFVNALYLSQFRL